MTVTNYILNVNFWQPKPTTAENSERKCLAFAGADKFNGHLLPLSPILSSYRPEFFLTPKKPLHLERLYFYSKIVLVNKFSQGGFQFASFCTSSAPTSLGFEDTDKPQLLLSRNHACLSLSAAKDQADKLPEDYICLQDELNHLRSQTIDDADESINDVVKK